MCQQCDALANELWHYKYYQTCNSVVFQRVLNTVSWVAALVAPVAPLTHVYGWPTNRIRSRQPKPQHFMSLSPHRRRSIYGVLRASRARWWWQRTNAKKQNRLRTLENSQCSSLLLSNPTTHSRYWVYSENWMKHYRSVAWKKYKARKIDLRLIKLRFDDWFSEEKMPTTFGANV